MTPEQRMRQAVEVARSEAERRGDPQRADIIAHGAAAIEAALAEQRALLVAWLDAERDGIIESALCSWQPSPEVSGALAHATRLKPIVERIKAGEPEAWVERTGWKMEETKE